MRRADGAWIAFLRKLRKVCLELRGEQMIGWVISVLLKVQITKGVKNVIFRPCKWLNSVKNVILLRRQIRYH